MATRIALFFLSFMLVAATAGASQSKPVQNGDQIVVAQSGQSTQSDKSTQSPDAKKAKKKGKKKSDGSTDEEPECD